MDDMNDQCMLATYITLLYRKANSWLLNEPWLCAKDKFTSQFTYCPLRRVSQYTRGGCCHHNTHHHYYHHYHLAYPSGSHVSQPSQHGPSPRQRNPGGLSVCQICLQSPLNNLWQQRGKQSIQSIVFSISYYFTVHLVSCSTNIQIWMQINWSTRILGSPYLHYEQWRGMAGGR